MFWVFFCSCHHITPASCLPYFVKTERELYQNIGLFSHFSFTVICCSGKLLNSAWLYTWTLLSKIEKSAVHITSFQIQWCRIAVSLYHFTWSIYLSLAEGCIWHLSRQSVVRMFCSFLSPGFPYCVTAQGLPFSCYHGLTNVCLHSSAVSSHLLLLPFHNRSELFPFSSMVFFFMLAFGLRYTMVYSNTLLFSPLVTPTRPKKYCPPFLNKSVRLWGHLCRAVLKCESLSVFLPGKLLDASVRDAGQLIWPHHHLKREIAVTGGKPNVVCFSP